MTLEEKLKKALIKLMFDYYEHGANTHTIIPDSDTKVIIEICQQEIDEYKPKWISVRDRLPDDEDRVAVLYRYKQSLRLIKWIAEYDIENKKWKTYQFDDCKIEYWMPLPESPKENT